MIFVLPQEALVVEKLDRVPKIGLKVEDKTSDIGDDVLEHSQEYSVIFASPGMFITIWPMLFVTSDPDPDPETSQPW